MKITQERLHELLETIDYCESIVGMSNEDCENLSEIRDLLENVKTKD